MADSAGTIQDQQLDRERREIEEAPKVPISALMPHNSGESGRCHWCGRLADDLVPVHDFHPAGNKIINERYKGAKCCGARHV